MRDMFNSNAVATIQEDKANLREILARDEYNPSHAEGFGLRDHIVKGIKYILKQIAKFIPDKFLPTSVGSINLISYLVIAAGICLLGFLVYWLVKQLTVQRRFSKGLQLSEQELKLSYHNYLQNAGKEAQATNWKEGARFLFLALLFYCEHKSWIRIEKWKTNGEYMTELQRKQPAIVQEFAEGALLFDKVWYGKKSINADEYKAMLRRIEPIIKEGKFDVSTQ